MSTDHGQEPIHDPLDLLDELDSIIRAQDMLRHRTIALQARYSALESHGDRFDKPHPVYGVISVEFGRINVKYTAERLSHAAETMGSASEWALHPARELAEKVREYPQPARSVERPEVDRRRSR